MLVDEHIYNTTGPASVKSCYDRALASLDHESIKRQARALWDMGLHFVVIPPCRDDNDNPAIGKRPVIPGWPDAAFHDFVSPDEIPAGCNLGVLCGTPVERNNRKYWVADNDIDLPAAAPVFVRTYEAFGIPKPFSWGREGKPNSHALFLIDEPMNTAGAAHEYHRIAEFRCQSMDGEYAPYGHQSVISPSVWFKDEEVEAIRQEPDSAAEPPAVSAALLFKAYRTAVAVCLLAPLFPDHPHRYHTRNAFYRVASRGGMPMEDAVRFITLVNEFSPHREQHWQQFKDEAKQIYEKAEDTDAHLYGFPTLVKNIGEEHRETLFDVFKLLALEKPKTEEEERGLPSGFSVVASGVYFTAERADDDDDEPKAFRICSKLEVISIVQSRDEDESGLEIAWNDMNAVRRTWTLPRNLLHNDASAVREELLRRGFQFIDPSRRGKELFVRYLMGCNPPRRKQSVNRVGWHGESYVTPTTVFTKKKDVEIVFQSSLAQRYTFQSGTLTEWQDNVSRKCSGNSRLVFMVSAAFAAPLMPFANAESGGFNFIGPSSSGKTTGALVATSVMSNKKYMQNWRATSNGLEAIAAQYNHALLPLDEIAQADAKTIGEMVYMLANSRGKMRMGKTGTLRSTYEWQNIFLSTGEKDLTTYMNEGGTKIKGGQMVRCLDVPSDAGVGFGLFENLHDAPNADVFSTTLQTATQTYYGTAFPAFITALLDNEFAKIKDTLEIGIKKFQAKVTPKGTISGEVSRAIHRFALVAAAGEIATSLLITGWNQGEAFDATKKCFDAWLTHRGGSAAGDVSNGISQVRHFLELHGASRFYEMGVLDCIDRTIQRCGFKERPGGLTSKEAFDYYILPEVFKNKVCKGYDATGIAKALEKRGILIRDGASLQARKYISGMGKSIRVYHVTSKIFEDELQ